MQVPYSAQALPKKATLTAMIIVAVKEKTTTAHSENQARQWIFLREIGVLTSLLVGFPEISVCAGQPNLREPRPQHLIIASTSTTSYSPKIKVHVIGSKPSASPKGSGRSPTITAAGIRTSTTTDWLPNAGITPSSDRTAPGRMWRFSAADRSPEGNLWGLGSSVESGA